MSVLENQNGIKYLVMQEEHRNDVLELTAEIFGNYEPTGKMVGSSPAIFKERWEFLFKYFVS